MTSWFRALCFGFLVWLVPIGVAFLIFPFKESWRSLFESIMPVTLAITVVGLGLLYFRRIPTPSWMEGLLLGLLWFAICVAIDLPLMLSPPIAMAPIEYAADIALTYLMIPVLTTGLALAARRRADSP